jgi:Peptidase inhibitor family I36
MSRVWLRVAVAVATCTTVLGFAASPSLASPVPVTDSNCPIGYQLCLYSRTNFTGLFYLGGEHAGDPPHKCYTMTGGAYGNVHSIANRGDEWKVFSNDTCSGSPFAKIYANTANTTAGGNIRSFQAA